MSSGGQKALPQPPAQKLLHQGNLQRKLEWGTATSCSVKATEWPKAGIGHLSGEEH